MYIIVVGGGKVGYYLSQVLVADGHEVLVLETEPQRVEFMKEELGSVVMRGDGCEAATLDQVGAGRSDMLIAVTGDDEDNLVACQVAKHRFKVPHTIALLNNPRNRTIFKILGVDVTVDSTDLILAHIEQELPKHPLIPLLTLKGGGLEIVEVKVPPDSTAIGKRLKDLPIPPESVISLIIGKEKGAQIPTEDTVLAAEDEVVAVTKPELEEALRGAFTGS
ncbi:MAG: NAD-binding protein [Dehalococcoidia bacterium]